MPSFTRVAAMVIFASLPFLPHSVTAQSVPTLPSLVGSSAIGVLRWISRSHLGSGATGSPSRRRRFLRTRNRNTSAPMTASACLARANGSPSRPAAPELAACGLAKAMLATFSVSPRLGSSPTMPSTAVLAAARSSALTDLSTSRATSILLIAPGATTVCCLV